MVGTLDVETGRFDQREATEPSQRPTRAFILLRSDGWPIGVDVLPLTGERGFEEIGRQLVAESAPSPARAVAPAGPISVVVCTRNRAALLRRNLPHLVRMVGAQNELIVVDNAPRDDSTAAVVADFGDRVRHIVEPIPGLARARNCGLDAAAHPYVLFTDDDIEPEPSWLDVIGATFAAHPGAVCVSGAVLPMSLSTPAELRFQEFGGYVADFCETAYHLTMNPPPSELFPFQPRLLGTGANMAFRAEALRSIGGFDTALGAGTAARGGEDIDVAVRLLMGGHLIVRQPAAVVWHASLTTDEELLAQIEAYGCGLAAAFAKFLSQRSTMGAVLRRLPVGVRTALSDNSAKNNRRSHTYPAELRRAELRGMGMGLFAYHKSRRHQREIEKVKNV
ncbi:MAG: glycosyltransferase [Actinomycetia bacterium]|nr:glycosyltransferase [Actinomycetes bacterium]